MTALLQLYGLLDAAVRLAAGSATRGRHLGMAAHIPTPSIDYLAIMPEILMLGGAVVLLAVASLVRRQLRVGVATACTMAISSGALGVSLWQWFDVSGRAGAFTSIDHAVVVDGYSAFVNILVSSAMLLTAMVGDGYLRRERVEGAEFHVLAMVSASGAMIMGSANDLIVIFLGLEILSIALYVLAAFNHRRAASGEAALKYFIMGSFSSAVFVYGIALVYGATGSTNLAQIAGFLAHNVVVSDGLLLAGLTLLIVGFSFKVAAVPFHMWTPDVYQGAPSPVTGFMAAVAKVGAFAAFLRVFVSSFGLLGTDWRPVVYALAVVTLVLGAWFAVVQRDVKRMLAYSSINHAGFVLLGLQAADARGVTAALYYLFAYTFMVIGSFAVVTVLGRRGDAAHDIASYRGLATRQPLLALMFAVLLLAQAGAPFTTGLWAKLQVVLAAVYADSVPLAVVAMVSAAIAAFFYLRVAVLMYTPLRVAGSVPGVEEPAEAMVPLYAGEAAVTGPAPEVGSGRATAGAQPEPARGVLGPQVVPATPVWAGTERAVASTSRLNAALLLDAGPKAAAVPADAVEGDAVQGVEVAAGEEAPAAGLDDRVPVPALSAAVIGICVAFTVVLGFWPSPLVDLAHHATLLFVP